MDKLTRRSFVKAVGTATAVPTAGLLAPVARPAVREGTTPDLPNSAEKAYLFFNAAEARFIEAACERLIPADECGPGALGAGVANFLDKQLGGAWGAGERLYRSGPWQSGTPTQGYQLPFTPAELFRTSLRALIRNLAADGVLFDELPGEAQDEYLSSVEGGGHDLDGVPSGVFFDMLLKMSVEGFFSDPVYGGNRNMAAWRMIGFPGAYADYFEAVDKHGMKFESEPMSLAEDGRGHVHMRQNIPANL